LKAVLRDGAVDTPSADQEAGLVELLRDDLDCGIRIEEAVTDDPANDFVGADIVAFGAGLVALESCASMLAIELEQLKISLPAEFELLSGLDGAGPFASAFNEHGKAWDDEVIRKNGELSSGANNAAGRYAELHGLVLREKAWWQISEFAIDTLTGYR
jgi:hypothetical protein